MVKVLFWKVSEMILMLTHMQNTILTTFYQGYTILDR